MLAANQAHSNHMTSSKLVDVLYVGILLTFYIIQVHVIL